METMIRLSVLLTMALYAVAAICYLAARNRKPVIKAANALGYGGFAWNACALLLRGILLGRPPLSDGGDFILIFVGLVALFALWFEHMIKTAAVNRYVFPFCSVLLFVVFFFMGDQLGTSTPLNPLLKSPLLSIHVVTAALSYAGFALAAGLAGARLRKPNYDADGKWTRRIVAGSFCMLTLAIVLGAFWAEVAWGSYWSWDPKETWALITWIVYAIYLHRRWQGKKSDIILILGFVFVIFTFFGVNYLFSGLHEYASL